VSNELSVSLGLSKSDDSDFILIEQQPWAKDVGRTSETQGILAIGSIIFGGNIPKPNCGGLAGFDTKLYVYPSRGALAFRFAVSHGEFIRGASGTVIREEVVHCSLSESSELEYPVNIMMSMEWIGYCYDALGNITARPSLTLDNNTLRFGSNVYGSIRVKYYVYRIEYNVRVEERDDSIENNFNSIAYCVWGGGVTYRDIKAPSGYDRTMGNCGNGLYGQIDFGDRDVEICQPEHSGSYPVSVKADRHMKINYCPQDIASDVITEAVERDGDSESCSDGSDDETITTN